MKVHWCQKNFHNTNEDYESFKNVINDSVLLSGIDDAAMLDNNEAYQLAYSICQEVLESSNKDEAAIFSFRGYLDLICTRAKRFSYEILSDINASKKKLLGILWMTATMRRNFELFGSSICLDMMKSGINKFLWPYIAVVMYDKANHICIACKGIVCGE